MPWLDEHVSAPGSINSKRITVKPGREGFVSMCACTEPVRTGIGAVYVEYGRPKWPITMLNHTHKQINKHTYIQKNVFVFYFWHPMLVRPGMKRLFCLKAKNGLIKMLSETQEILYERPTPWDAPFLSPLLPFHESRPYVLMFLSVLHKANPQP